MSSKKPNRSSGRCEDHRRSRSRFSMEHVEQPVPGRKRFLSCIDCVRGVLDDDRMFRCRLHHPDGRGGLITGAQEATEERWPEEQPRPPSTTAAAAAAASSTTATASTSSPKSSMTVVAASRLSLPSSSTTAPPPSTPRLRGAVHTGPVLDWVKLPSGSRQLPIGRGRPPLSAPSAPVPASEFPPTAKVPMVPTTPPPQAMAAAAAIEDDEDIAASAAPPAEEVPPAPDYEAQGAKPKQDKKQKASTKPKGQRVCATPSTAAHFQTQDSPAMKALKRSQQRGRTAFFIQEQLQKPARTAVTRTPVIVLPQPSLAKEEPGTVPGTMVRPFGVQHEEWMTREEVWSQPFTPWDKDIMLQLMAPSAELSDAYYDAQYPEDVADPPLVEDPWVDRLEPPLPEYFTGRTTRRHQPRPHELDGIPISTVAAVFRSSLESSALVQGTSIPRAIFRQLLATLTAGLLAMDIASEVADDDHDRSDMEAEFATAHHDLEDDVAVKAVAEAATIPAPAAIQGEDDDLPSASIVAPEVPSAVEEDDHPASDTTMTPEVPLDAEDDPSTSWSDAVDVDDAGELAVSVPFTMFTQLPLDDEPSLSVEPGRLATNEEAPGEKSLDMLPTSPDAKQGRSSTEPPAHAADVVSAEARS